MTTRNFRVRNDVVERRSVTKSQKGKKAYVERKVGECFQWNNVPKKTHVVSVMTHKLLETVAKVRDENIRRQNRLTARDKNLQRHQAKKTKLFGQK